MNTLRAAVAALCLATILPGCATKPLIPPTLTVVVAQGDTTVDAIYNAVAKVYLAKAPTMAPALKAKLKPILASAYKAVAAADAAEILGDANTVTAQVQAAGGFIAQAKALLGQ